MPSTSGKLMTLLHTLISFQICRVVRALFCAKSFLVKVARKDQCPVRLIYSRSWHGGRKGCGHAYFGSFRLHYNWCSSRSFSMPGSVLDGLRPSYLPYDVTTGNVADEDGLSGLSRYLRWLEERKSDGESSAGDNEIDELADEFMPSATRSSYWRSKSLIGGFRKFLQEAYDLIRVINA